MPPRQKTLRDFIQRAYIVCYKENIDVLSEALECQGIDCVVCRQVHRPGHETYSSSYLCLLNHVGIWKNIVDRNELGLIVEADFVPTRRMMDLPVPFDVEPSDQGNDHDRPIQNLGMSWLYTCAPQVYSVSAQGKAIGFSASTVAYVVSPQAAQVLLKYAEAIRENPGPTQYSSWDSGIEEVMRKHQLQSYIAFRCYGEHGGKANPEHRLNGLSPEHRADILYDDLAFLPPYATDESLPWLTLFLTRCQGRIKGLGRLLLGRYIRLQTLKKSSIPLRIIRFVISRHLTARV